MILNRLLASVRSNQSGIRVATFPDGASPLVAVECSMDIRSPYDANRNNEEDKNGRPKLISTDR